MDYRKTFLSYPHEDVTLARQLARLLVDSGVTLWLDEWELPSNLAGTALDDALTSAIGDVDAMVILETESYRERQSQKVPGNTLAHATARPAVPLNDSPIIGHEQSVWIMGRNPEQVLFKSVLLRMTTRPGRPLRLRIAEHTRVIERTVPHEDISLTPRRKAVYRYKRPGQGWSSDYVSWSFVDWPTSEPPPRPLGYDTLIGEEVHFRATSAETALPTLLDELRAP